MENTDSRNSGKPDYTSELIRILDTTLEKLKADPADFPRYYDEFLDAHAAYHLDWHCARAKRSGKLERYGKVIDFLLKAHSKSDRPGEEEPQHVSLLLARDHGQVRSHFIGRVLNFFTDRASSRTPVILRMHRDLARWDIEFCAYRAGFPLEKALMGELSGNEVDLLCKTIDDFINSPCVMDTLRPGSTHDLVQAIRQTNKKIKDPLYLIDGLDLIPGFMDSYRGLFAELQSMSICDRVPMILTLYPDFSLTDDDREIIKNVNSTYPRMTEFTEVVSYFDPSLKTGRPIPLLAQDQIG